MKERATRFERATNGLEVEQDFKEQIEYVTDEEVQSRTAYEVERQLIAPRRPTKKSGPRWKANWI